MPLVVVTLVVGLMVFRQGWIRAHLTETDVINHYAAQYVAQTGGAAKVTDCVATPGVGDGVWIVLRCASEATGTVRRFAVDRMGRIVAPPPRPAGPET